MKKIIQTIVVAIVVMMNFLFVWYAAPSSIPGRFVSGVLGILISAPSTGSTEPLNLAFKCEEPLPEFTLGAYSNPSSDEISGLCSCVWNALPGASRDFAIRLNSDDAFEPDEGLVGIFSASFAAAMESCNAMDLS